MRVPVLNFCVPVFGEVFQKPRYILNIEPILIIFLTDFVKIFEKMKYSIV